MADQKIENKGESGIKFIFSHDIYVYLLLLYERLDNNGKPLINRIPRSESISIYYFSIGAFLIQMIAVLYLAVVGVFNGEEIFYTNSSNIQLECEGGKAWNPNLNSTNFTITNQACIFKTSDRVDLTSHLPPFIGAKVIAVLLVTCFLSSEITNLPRFTVLISKSRSYRMMVLWISLTLSTLLLILCTVIRVFSLIYNSGKITDILSVGIGFILLLDLDNELMKSVEQGNIFGDELFELEFKKKDLHDTLYYLSDPETYDSFIWAMFATGTTIQAFYYSIWWKADASPAEWAVQISVPTLAALIFQISPCIFPIIFTIYRKCRKEKN